MKEDKNLPVAKKRTVLFTSNQYDLLFKKSLSETVSETLSVSDEVYRESEIVVGKIIEDIRLRLKNSKNIENINTVLSKVDGNLSLKVFEQCNIDVTYSLYAFANYDAYRELLKQEKREFPEAFGSSNLDGDKGPNCFEVSLVIYMFGGKIWESNLFGNVHHELNHVFKLFKRGKGFNYRFNMYPITSKKLFDKSKNNSSKKSWNEKTLEEQVSDALDGMVYFAEQFEIDAEIQMTYRELLFNQRKIISYIKSNLHLVNDKKKFVEGFIRSLFKHTSFYVQSECFRKYIDLVSQNRELADNVLKREYTRKKPSKDSSNGSSNQTYASKNLTIGSFLKYCRLQYNYIQSKVNNLLKRVYVTIACTDSLKDILTFGVFGMSDKQLNSIKKKYMV